MRPAAEEGQPLHDHIRALFYRRSAIPSDATPAPQPTPAPPPRIKGIGAYSVTLQRQSSLQLLPSATQRSGKNQKSLAVSGRAIFGFGSLRRRRRGVPAITRDSSARRYGIELDAYRAEQAGPSLPKIVQGNCLETHCAVESFSLCFCNPPYDWALAGNARERLETVFLNHIFRWLIPGGVLLLVIPAERATDCAQILASHFKRARVFRLPHPECGSLSPGPHCRRSADAP